MACLCPSTMSEFSLNRNFLSGNANISPRHSTPRKHCTMVDTEADTMCLDDLFRSTCNYANQVNSRINERRENEKRAMGDSSGQFCKNIEKDLLFTEVTTKSTDYYRGLVQDKLSTRREILEKTQQDMADSFNHLFCAARQVENSEAYSGLYKELQNLRALVKVLEVAAERFGVSNSESRFLGDLEKVVRCIECMNRQHESALSEITKLRATNMDLREESARKIPSEHSYLHTESKRYQSPYEGEKTIYSTCDDKPTAATCGEDAFNRPKIAPENKVPFSDLSHSVNQLHAGKDRYVEREDIKPPPNAIEHQHRQYNTDCQPCEPNPICNPCEPNPICNPCERNPSCHPCEQNPMCNPCERKPICNPREPNPISIPCNCETICNKTAEVCNCVKIKNGWCRKKIHKLCESCKPCLTMQELQFRHCCQYHQPCDSCTPCQPSGPCRSQSCNNCNSNSQPNNENHENCQCQQPNRCSSNAYTQCTPCKCPSIHSEIQHVCYCNPPCGELESCFEQTGEEFAGRHFQSKDEKSEPNLPQHKKRKKSGSKKQKNEVEACGKKGHKSKKKGLPVLEITYPCPPPVRPQTSSQMACNKLFNCAPPSCEDVYQQEVGLQTSRDSDRALPCCKNSECPVEYTHIDRRNNVCSNEPKESAVCREVPISNRVCNDCRAVCPSYIPIMTEAEMRHAEQVRRRKKMFRIGLACIAIALLIMVISHIWHWFRAKAAEDALCKTCSPVTKEDEVFTVIAEDSWSVWDVLGLNYFL